MNQEKIGKFIAESRKEKNMTQQELADKLGVTDRAVSHWENGRRLPDYSLLKDLCNILQISVNELFAGEKISNKDYMYTKNIFADTMEEYLKDTKESWYSIPNNVVGVLVDPISGLPIDENSQKKKILYYLKGTEPTNTQSVFDEIT